MRETLDISPTIIEQLAETPEERLYWTAGVRHTLPVECYASTLDRFDSERAAWIAREQALRKPHAYAPNGYPKSQTRSDVTQRAKESHCTTIEVLDETGAIVESWEVE